MIFLNKLELFSISAFSAFLFLLSHELLYLFNFTSLSFVKLFKEILNTTFIFAFLVLLLMIVFTLFFISLFLRNRFYQKNIFVIFLICASALYMIMNFFLSFRIDIKKLGINGQICLFSAIYLSNTTFLYSIFYGNLLQLERIKGDVEK